MIPKDLHLPIVSPTSGFGVTPQSRFYSVVLCPLLCLLAKPTRGSPSCAFTQAVECGWEQGKQHSPAFRSSQFKSTGATDVSPSVLFSPWHWSVHRGNFFTGVFCCGVNKQRPHTPAVVHRATPPGVPALIERDSFETTSPTSLSSPTLMFSGYFAEIRRKVANPVLKGISSRANNTHVGALSLVCFLRETAEKRKCQLTIR